MTHTCIRPRESFAPDPWGYPLIPHGLTWQCQTCWRWWEYRWGSPLYRAVYWPTWRRVRWWHRDTRRRITEGQQV